MLSASGGGAGADDDDDATLLVPPACTHELIVRAIDAIRAVLELRLGIAPQVLDLLAVLLRLAELREQLDALLRAACGQQPAAGARAIGRACASAPRRWKSRERRSPQTVRP